MEGRKLFTFAVITDSHINEDDHSSVSPFESNNEANHRFLCVVEDLRKLNPEFTIHLGDMGNPIPSLETYEAAAYKFKEIVKGLKSPLHLVPGNHCVGDKPQGIVPVPRVCPEFLEKYSENYGKHFYSFDHGPCHFVVINATMINSGLDEEQNRWLQEDLRNATGRIFVMMHYPIFVSHREEPGSYDNVDEPGRSALLSLLKEHDVEAVYTGHVHNYFLNLFKGIPMYTVPAISFVRQDYAELYSISPDDAEGGRNDVAKLGYFLVDVYEEGHRNRFVRTFGESGANKNIKSRNLGVNLHENWLLTRRLSTNDSFSPFLARPARNDWPLLALNEIGATKIRLPASCALDAADRVKDLSRLGYEFIVYSDVPPEEYLKFVETHNDILAGWETHEYLESSCSVPQYLNPVFGFHEDQIGSTVHHRIQYGFSGLDSLPNDSRYRGFVFRIPNGADLSIVSRIDEHGKAHGMHHLVHLRIAGDNTAIREEDDDWISGRIQEATTIALESKHLDLIFEAFEDIDRGYYVRHGLVDRRYNPRNMS